MKKMKNSILALLLIFSVLSCKQEVKKTELPQDITPEVGMGLVSKSPDGQETNLLVVEVKEESIVIDGNHPLAGKDLIFDLEVVAIKETEVTK